MLTPSLYESFYKTGLEVVECPKRELKEKLQRLGENLNLKEEALIIEAGDTMYKIYYVSKDAKKETVSVELDLAMKFRVELDLYDLDRKMLQLAEKVLKYPFTMNTLPYCLVRYMDLEDDFLILDVYVGVEESERCV